MAILKPGNSATPCVIATRSFTHSLIHSFAHSLIHSFPPAFMETRKSDLIRAFVRGGILSPADLLKIIGISRSLGNRYILFGSRQDIMFPSNGTSGQVLADAFNAIGIDYEVGSD